MKSVAIGSIFKMLQKPMSMAALTRAMHEALKACDQLSLYGFGALFARFEKELAGFEL